MEYVSTRGGIDPIKFQQAVLMGLADDRGLIVPEALPDVSGRLDDWRSLSYPQLAFEVISRFATDVPAGELRELLERTYGPAFEDGVAPVVPVGDLHVMELWHGPTLAFKDIALQLLGNLFEHILARSGGKLNILGATSGDTGSAAIYGCRGRDRIDIFVMHPHGRVSPIQQRQMTTVLDPNVHNIAVEGSFDDCQRIMKELAGDVEFKRAYHLGAVNSVNWARVLAQIVYYFWGTFRLREATGAEEVRVCVPTGNFGDILAGYYARRMGCPIGELVLATNENDILARFFTRGVYELGEVHRTLSPSMDIQVASNFERYLYDKVGQDPRKLRERMETFAETGRLEVPVEGAEGVDPAFRAGVGTREEVLETIKQYHLHHDYLLDPHTAVGVAVAERVGLSDGPPVLCLATAHPAKFPDAIVEATGEDLAHHPKIDALKDLPTRCKVLPNDREAVRRFIEETVGEDG